MDEVLAEAIKHLTNWRTAFIDKVQMKVDEENKAWFVQHIRESGAFLAQIEHDLIIEEYGEDL